MTDWSTQPCTSTRNVPSRGGGVPKRRVLPAAHLRVLLALIVLAELDTERDILAERLVATNDLLSLLPPRKAGTVRKSGERHEPGACVDARSLFTSLSWLDREGLAEVTPLGARQLGHRVRLTVDAEEAREPRWPHARRLALDAVRLKRLPPADIAILGRLAYVADADGHCQALAAKDAEFITGLCFRWVEKRLAAGELRPAHGLASWSADGRGANRRLIVELCEPDESRVNGKPLARLHHQFVANALGVASASVEDDARSVPVSAPAGAGDATSAALNSEATTPGATAVHEPATTRGNRANHEKPGASAGERTRTTADTPSHARTDAFTAVVGQRRAATAPPSSTTARAGGDAGATPTEAADRDDVGVDSVGGPLTPRKATAPKTDEDWRAEALAVRALCWDRERIDDALRAVKCHTKVTPRQVVQRFYGPAYQLQGAYDNGSLTKYALDAINRATVLHEPDAITAFSRYLGGIYRREANSRGLKPVTQEAVRQVELVKAVESHQQAVEQRKEREAHEAEQEHQRDRQRKAAEVATRFLAKARGFASNERARHIQHIAQQFDKLGLGDYYEVHARLEAAAEQDVKTWTEAERMQVAVRCPRELYGVSRPTRDEEVALGKAGARSQRQADAQAKLLAPLSGHTEGCLMDTRRYARPNCRVCGGKGRVQTGTRISDMAICPCVLATKRQVDAERVIELRFPGQLRKLTLDSYDTGGDSTNEHALLVARNFVEHYEKAIEEGWLVTFFGPPGCGKTHLAVGTAQECTRRFLAKPLIWNIAAELRRERERYGQESPSKSPVSRAIEAELLVLDDLGAEYHRTGAVAGAEVTWAYEQLYTILDARILECRPTLITTNLSPAELRQRMDNPAAMRVLSRIERAEAVAPLEVVPVPGAGRPNRRRSELLEGELP